MTTCGALGSTSLDRMASSMRTKSPAVLLTTAERIALAPLGMLTRDLVSAKSSGMSHGVVVRSSPLLLAPSEMGLRAKDGETNASAVRGYHNAAVARVAAEAKTRIVTVN